MKLLYISIILTFCSCSENTNFQEPQVISESVYHLDESRDRIIPMEVYKNTNGNHENGVVIINAGYGCSNTEYTYLARFLVLNSYLVVSTHHEHQIDEILPPGENIYNSRRPN